MHSDQQERREWPDTIAESPNVLRVASLAAFVVREQHLS
jgi:hypothetical protein